MLVNGLIFDRRIWQLIIDRLGDSVTSLAIGLPVHGESKGEPVPMQDVGDQVHSLVQAFGLERPIVVGYSIAAAAAALYAATYPTRGIVIIDQAAEVLLSAQMLHQAAPMLCGPEFGQVWAGIEDSLGIERVPEPTRSLVRDNPPRRPAGRARVLEPGTDHRPGRDAGVD